MAFLLAPTRKINIQSAETDIHTLSPKRPEQFKIRYTLFICVYTPTRPLYTKSAHTDMHILRSKRPKSPDIRNFPSIRLYAPTRPLAHYLLKVLT